VGLLFQRSRLLTHEHGQRRREADFTSFSLLLGVFCLRNNSGLMVLDLLKTADERIVDLCSVRMRRILDYVYMICF